MDTAQGVWAQRDSAWSDSVSIDSASIDSAYADTAWLDRVETGRGDGSRKAGRGARNVVTAAELLTPSGSACPVFPRPPSERDPRHGLIVALAFDIDSTGLVDSTTVRVVQAPGAPPPGPEFFPHIYIVSTTIREEGEFHGPVEAYDSLVTDDVRRHLATLHFRPASKDGRPVRGSVLVSCQAR